MSLIALQKKIKVVPDNDFGPKTLRAAKKYFKLNRKKAAHFFGQVAHETSEFKYFSENLSYSRGRMLAVFGKYFRDKSNSFIDSYVRNPKALANLVYANRIGNGLEESGDGYKFRGRGALQLTGRSNYEEFSSYVKDPEVMINPDLVATEYSFESAMFFFTRHNLWDICNDGVNYYNVKRLTRRINGGYNGLDHRKDLTYKYYEIM